MDKQLREIAFSIVESGKVDKKIVDSFISKLPAKDQKKFLGYLILALDKNTITITTATDSPSVVEYFEKKYANKHIKSKTDDTIGGGVIVKIADDVYDYSVRNYINTTIDRLSE